MGTPAHPQHEGESSMKQQFTEAKTRKEAKEIMEWAERIVKVEGGYMGFESEQDYLIWKNQK